MHILTIAKNEFSSWLQIFLIFYPVLPESQSKKTADYFFYRRDEDFLLLLFVVLLDED